MCSRTIVFYESESFPLLFMLLIEYMGWNYFTIVSYHSCLFFLNHDEAVKCLVCSIHFSNGFELVSHVILWYQHIFLALLLTFWMLFSPGQLSSIDHAFWKLDSDINTSQRNWVLWVLYAVWNIMYTNYLRAMCLRFFWLNVHFQGVQIY